MILIIASAVFGAGLAAVFNGDVDANKWIGLENSLEAPNIGFSEAQENNESIVTETVTMTQVSTVTSTNIVTSTTNIEALDDVSCKNLEDVITEYLARMESKIVRRTIGNLTHYWEMVEFGAADSASNILQVYLKIYEINNCPPLEYPQNMEIITERTDVPTPPNVRVVESPVLNNPPTTFNVTLVNFGGIPDTVLSVSTTVNGTRYKATIDTDTTIPIGDELKLHTTFARLNFISGTQYQIRIVFESGNQIALQAIAS